MTYMTRLAELNPSNEGAHLANPQSSSRIFCRLPSEIDTLTSLKGVLMRPRLIAAILLLVSGTVAFAQSQPVSPKADSPIPSSATELSPDQKAGIIEIISEARENGEMVAKRLRSNTKKFDEVVLADTIDPVLEKRCVDGITAAIYDSTQFRLQAATQVVHQLTAEQRRYLKAEMAKSDSEQGILEAVPKVFHLKLEDKDQASPK